MYGLFQFLFKQGSKRLFNEHLTTPSLFEMLNKFFPEIESIPHADTIARLLKRINPTKIEYIHVDLIRGLINNKKFKKLLIYKCLPVSIDGTQKAVRDGQLQEDGWLLRTVTTKEGKEFQQYVYVLEANITFANGLNIPLLTEYCYLDADLIKDDVAKQDCELGGFERIKDKLKKHFSKLKIILMLDNLYACDNVIKHLKNNNWEFMIKLPSKLKSVHEPLKECQCNSQSIPGQLYYRERAQSFYWKNNIKYKGNIIHAVACTDKWREVSNTTGKFITKRSEHTWISSQPLSIDNVHTLCNLAARKRAFIEDSFNTEKNRGYHYQHVFSYDWNAMKGFHYLMRLAHAINAISEFTKKLKKHIRELGVSNTLFRIFEAIKHPWLSDEWLKKELRKKPQLRFQFE